MQIFEPYGSTVYFRLRNKAFWLKIVGFWGVNGPLLQQNPLEKVGGEAPHWVLR